MQTTCPGCSCLCDDIIVDVDENEINVKNACRRGASIFINHNMGRSKALIEDKPSDIDDAIKKASELIADSKNFVIYGMDTIPVEVQKTAINLAEKKGAFIDDSSSFCLGNFVEACLKKQVPTTTFDEVKDNAYLICYWGSNTFHSLPRHMSRYSYFPRGKNRQRGYEEDRFLVIIDIRENQNSKIVKRNGIFLEIESDIQLIEDFEKVIEGRAGDKFTNEVATILREMKRGDSVIFGGLGLRYGLKAEGYQRFFNLLNKLNETSRVYFIPAGFHSNMRGFNENLFERTGFVNKYSFAEQSSRDEFEFSKLIMNEIPDTALIIGSDPVHSLPFDVSKKLKKINTIVVDPRNTFTSRISKVVIPSAISGVENGGEMVRADGVRVELNPISKEKINDNFIIKKFLGAV
jgi:formylmethanofuran dehydrogenase subunit B